MLTGLRPDDTEGVELREASQLSRLLRLPSKGLRPPSGVAGFPILRRGETLGGSLRGGFAFSGTTRLVSAEWVITLATQVNVNTQREDMIRHTLRNTAWLGEDGDHLCRSTDSQPVRVKINRREMWFTPTAQWGRNPPFAGPCADLKESNQIFAQMSKHSS